LAEATQVEETPERKRLFKVTTAVTVRQNLKPRRAKIMERDL